MSNLYFQRISELVSNYTGIKIRPEEQLALEEKINIRLKRNKINKLEDYYSLLILKSQESQLEWQELLKIITNQESYFFRDQGQINLLKNVILPEIIKEKNSSKNLRICSAGCSTGEEPYSLAILLQELLPELEAWNLFILGMDINPEALEKAKKGIYTPWSFRLVEEGIKNRFFSASFNNYEYSLKDSVKKLVKFKQVNLVKDSWVDDQERFDLIICRNVFIYFESQAIATVLDKFYQALQPWGYLLTGHAELAGQKLNQFQGKIFPESIIYQPLTTNPFILTNLQPPQVKSSLPEENFPKIIPVIASLPKPQQTEQEMIKEVETLVEQKAYQLGIDKLKKILTNSPNNYHANFLLAKIYANQGKHKEGTEYAKKSIKINSLAIDAYYLLAQIAQENSELEEGKRLYKQIIYLDPSSLIAYLELTQIYDQEGDQTRSKKMQELALDILQKLPDERKIAEMGGISVKELKQTLDSTLRKNT